MSRREVLRFTDILWNEKEVKISKESLNKEFRKSIGDYEYMYLNI